MRSLGRFPAVTAVLSAAILAPSELVAASTTPANSEAYGYTAWMIGLLCGILLTIASRIHWRDVPHRIAQWFRNQTTRAGWFALGVGYTFVLLFY